VIIRERVVTSGRKLRTFSGWELGAIVLRMTLSPRMIRARSGLDVWYGPRREE
jgi:hypothetical protein